MFPPQFLLKTDELFIQMILFVLIDISFKSLKKRNLQVSVCYQC